MYPTLIIIVCAANKSLNERSVEDHAQSRTIVFNAPGSQSGPHQTPSELSEDSVSSVRTEHVDNFQEDTQDQAEDSDGGSYIHTLAKKIDCPRDTVSPVRTGLILGPPGLKDSEVC